MARIATLHHIHFFTTLVEYYDKMLEDFATSKDIIFDYIKRRQENDHLRSSPDLNHNSMIRSYCTPEGIEAWRLEEPYPILSRIVIILIKFSYPLYPLSTGTHSYV